MYNVYIYFLAPSYECVCVGHVCVCVCVCVGHVCVCRACVCVGHVCVCLCRAIKK